MKTALTAVLALSLALPLFAADDWPQKGDVVRVPVRLPGFSGMIIAPGMKTPRFESLNPCAPLILHKASSDKSRFLVLDEESTGRDLRGPWVRYFYRTEQECRSAVENGQVPRIKAFAMRYTILEDAHD